MIMYSVVKTGGKQYLVREGMEITVDRINIEPASVPQKTGLRRGKEGKKVELESTITCPNCGHKKTEMMPTNACEFFFECENCKTRLRPLEGDCCVYCSYGTVKCPPIQAGSGCC